MSQTIDKDTILQLTAAFNNSPDSELRHYVLVTKDPLRSLLIRRKDYTGIIYIHSLKPGDEVLSSYRGETEWVRFTDRFEGVYLDTNLATYLAKLLNKNKGCELPPCTFHSMPVSFKGVSHLLVSAYESLFYFDQYGRFTEFAGPDKDNHRQCKSMAMPIPNFIIRFMIEELKMRHFYV